MTPSRLADAHRPVPRDKPHWYHVTFAEGCVLCGYGAETIRERRPGKRPKDPAKCYAYDSTPHACGSHFC